VAAAGGRVARPRRALAADGAAWLCHAPAPIAPVASTYRGGGLIHHQWLCVPCGHVGTTVVRMPE